MTYRMKTTVIAGSAALIAGAALAQEPSESQNRQDPQTQNPTSTSSQTRAEENASSTATANRQSQNRQSQNQQAQNRQAQDRQSQDEQAEDQQSQTARQDQIEQTTESRPIRQARADGSASSVMMMVLVPVALEAKTGDTLANGCWAKLYGGRDYKGDSFTMVGPMDMADMVGPFGVDWDDKVSSIKTGPKATVTIYDNENFRDRSARIQAGRQVPHLTEKLGFLEEVESMRINCEAKSGA